MTGEGQANLGKQPKGKEYQGIVIQFLSLLIGITIIVFIIVIIGRVSGFGMTVPWWLGLLYFVIYMGYFTLFEGSKGQTYR